MMAYQIYYYAHSDTKVDDIYIANTSIEAIKKFVIDTKWKYNVAYAIPVQKPSKSQAEDLKQLLSKTLDLQFSISS